MYVRTYVCSVYVCYVRMLGTQVGRWTTLRRWPWCFKVFLLLSAITSGHLRSVGWGGVGWG